MTAKKNFSLIGAGGYVAPRHMKAIKDTGNELVSALDIHDSVGVLDRYFPQAQFFTEFERYDRHAEKLRRLDEEQRIHYVSICSPNYLHDAHIRFALRIGAHAICEKPLVLNPWNLDALSEFEQEYGKRINCVLQLRLHPAIISLKDKIAAGGSAKRHRVKLTYITPRGHWYFTSWKGQPEKAGGVATNIGVHFFDMLIWIFGNVKDSQVHFIDPRKMSGALELERADVEWFLSVDKNDLGEREREENKAFRSLVIDGEKFEFSDGFTDLHTAVYQDVLDGGGYGLADVRPSIELVHAIRNAKVRAPSVSDARPLFKGKVLETAESGRVAGVHPSAFVDEPAQIGEGAKIWHFTHVMSGAKIGRGSTIGQNCYIGGRAVVGDNVKIQNNVSVYDLVTLEDNVFVGPSAVFTNDMNPRAAFPKGGTWIPTNVGRGATIGANATIVCGVTIGRSSFVGAGAVVTKDVPDFAVVAGVPARVIGWMCECGEKLAFEGDRADCACGRGYWRSGGIVRQAEAEDSF